MKDQTLFMKLLTYASEHDYDAREANILDLIRIVQSEETDEEDLCEVSNIMMLFDMFDDLARKNNLKFLDIVNNQFTKVTG